MTTPTTPDSETDALMSGPFNARERALVELLTRTVKERAERSAAADADLAAQLEAEHRDHRHKTRVEEDAYRTMREKLTAKLERSLKRLDENFHAQYSSIDREYQSQRVAIAEQLNKQERAIDEKLKETTWLAETVFDAEEAKPRLLLDRVTRSAESSRKHAAEIEALALRKAKPYIGGSLAAPPEPASLATDDPDKALAEVELELQQAQQALHDLQRAWILKLWGGLFFLAPLLMLAAAAFAGYMTDFSGWTTPLLAAGGTFLAFVIVLLPLRMLGVRQIRNAYVPVAQHLLAARLKADASVELAERQREEISKAILQKKQSDIAAARHEHAAAKSEIDRRRSTDVKAIDDQFRPQLQACIDKCDEDRKLIRSQATERIDRLDQEHAETLQQIQRAHDERIYEIEQAHRAEHESIERDWFQRMHAVAQASADMADRAQAMFPAWSDPKWNDYHPPAAATPAIQFGILTADASTFEGGLPDDPHWMHTVQPLHELPAMLDFPGASSLLIETGPQHREQGIATLQNLMLRILTSIPPGKLRFTIIDPVGLGQSFAGFMHLADYEESLVTNRIWTDPKHIEQRLADLTEHMEKVIQKYLRNEFESIEHYNQAAGEIAEPYRFLIIADFPTSFTDAAAQRLKSILESGSRCGVYTLVLLDPAAKLPAALSLQDIERHAITLVETDHGLRMADNVLSRLPLQLEAPPDDAFLSRIVRRVGELSKDAGRVEVPFKIIAPPPDRLWSESASNQLRVPLGRAGATKNQYLELGRGTSQHVLIAGKTGSGKSTLLHVLVASLAQWYSPREIELYLVDFKKGVEFKTYATHRLAHARAVAVESDREFGLSVLHKLDEELKRRGDLFRQAGAQDIAGFRQRQPDVHMPRTLLIIDEFQEFFVEDDKIAQDASLLLDRLVRQGRAFGMHVLLGSQTLSGAYSLARSTMGQMAVRIALQCSETDSYLILSEDNAAARLLARPGEAIYNDANGMIEGNSPFQIAWLPDATRDHALDQVRKRVESENYAPPEPQIVFEGNVPARLQENHEIARLVAARPDVMPLSARAWLGDPVAIKEPTAALFRRHSGSNCLIVGQHDDPALALAVSSIVSLAAQFPNNAARFVVLDGTPPDDPRAGTLKHVCDALPHDVRFGNWRIADELIADLAAELATREEQNLTDEQAVFLIVHGVHRFRSLRRKEDDFGFSMDADTSDKSPDKHLAAILREGSGLGIHVLLWADTVSNLERALERQSVGEFDTRVLFQMNAADSTTLIDSPAAGKLGMQRALLYNEESGTIEKFRPYALADFAWVRETLSQM